MKWDTVKHSSCNHSHGQSSLWRNLLNIWLAFLHYIHLPRHLSNFPPLNQRSQLNSFAFLPPFGFCWLLLTVIYVISVISACLLSAVGGLAARKIYAKCPGMRWSSTHFRHDTADLTWLYSTWLDTSSATSRELGDLLLLLLLLETWAGASFSSYWTEPR